MGRTVAFVPFGHRYTVSLSNSNEGGSAVRGGGGGEYVPGLISKRRCSFPDMIFDGVGSRREVI